MRGNHLSDMDRKILTIIQHNYKRGKFVDAQEVAFRSGYEENEVTGEVQRLIAEGWIEEHDGKWFVLRTLF